MDYIIMNRFVKPIIFLLLGVIVLLLFTQSQSPIVPTNVNRKNHRPLMNDHKFEKETRIPQRPSETDKKRSELTDDTLDDIFDESPENERTSQTDGKVAETSKKSEKSTKKPTRTTGKQSATPAEKPSAGKQSATPAEKPSAVGEKPAEHIFRCHNKKGEHLNNWDYFLNNVLHSEHIYDDIDVVDYKFSSEGWTHLKNIFKFYLNEWIRKNVGEHESRTVRIVEVGSWKGLSSTTMAEICRELAPRIKCTLLSIDTWLGAPIVYTDPNAAIHRELKSNNGRVPIFETFLKNVKVKGLQDIVKPFRMTSLGAAHVLKCFQMKADFLYVDADHEYEGVKPDLNAYYPILNSGGLFFGDDISQYTGVKRAVTEFFEQNALTMLDNRLEGNTWLTWKP